MKAHRLTKETFDKTLNNIKSVLFNVNNLGGDQVAEIYEALKKAPPVFREFLPTPTLVNRTFNVQELRKYDILFAYHGAASKHFMIIHKIIDDKVYVVTITSTQSCMTGDPIKENRMFKGGFYTHLIQIVDLETAQQSYVGTLSDGRNEFNKHIRKLKRLYKKLF